jgi:hypothetical protein
MLVFPVMMHHGFHFGVPLFDQVLLSGLPALIPVKLPPLR